MATRTLTSTTNGHAKSGNGMSNVSLADSKRNGNFQNGNGTTLPRKKRPYKRPSESNKGRKLAECLFGLSLPLWWTASFQANEPSCRVSFLITSTTVIYGILYSLLRHYHGFLQPSLSSWLIANAKNQNQQQNSKINGNGNSNTSDNGDSGGDDNQAALAAASEWRSRLLAIFNALILIVGSVLCFTEWVSTYAPESEGWVKTLPLQCNDSIDGGGDCSCFSSHPVTYASLFVGYLQWDLCWLIWHRDTHPDGGSMIHHSIFIGVTQFVLSETYFRKPFAWLALTGLSTPFLHVRWILAATGQKSNGLYFWVSLGFALTFLSTRSVGYGLGLVDVWRNRTSWGVISGLWGVVAGLHLAYLLNLLWSFKVGSALVRTISNNSTTTNNNGKGTPKQKPE
jgi:hypothetical protein